MKLCPQCDTGYPDRHTTCPTHGVLLNEIRDLKPGMVIHHSYRIVRKLGQGGMGAVYLAHHTLMDEPRALKFLSSELSNDQAFTRRFLREVRTLRQVRNKNVVECGDLERAEDDSLFFSMEFVDGPDLRAFYRDASKPFEVRLALDITRSIAEGLGAAHVMGMVHRDIKPENILITRDGNGWIPKIADFGIVATKENSSLYTLTGYTMLTMAYAAPEQWCGMRAADLDGRTDIYALGGVLFEMLTGQKVFNGESYESWAELHKNVAPAAPSALRPELANWKGLDALVLRMLAKNREQRPNDVQVLLSLIDAIVNTPPIAPRVTRVETQLLSQESEPEPKLRRGISRPLVAAALSLLAVVAVAVLVNIVSGSSENSTAPPPTARRSTSDQPSDATGQPTTTDQPQPKHEAKPDIAAIAKKGEALYLKGPTSEAAPLLDQACSGGNGYSCSLLAELYYQGNGVASDTVRAVSLDTRACKLGDGRACDGLGNRYGSGIGVTESQRLAEEFHRKASVLFTKACDAGNGDACVDLGIQYYAGPAGIPQDHPRALALFSKACDADNVGGCSVLASNYEKGEGVEKDTEKARQLWVRVCALQHEAECSAADKLK
jgi:serine/threonine protein kinase